jgi:hypothetical protein
MWQEILKNRRKTAKDIVDTIEVVQPLVEPFQEIEGAKKVIEAVKDEATPEVKR